MSTSQVCFLNSHVPFFRQSISPFYTILSNPTTHTHQSLTTISSYQLPSHRRRINPKPRGVTPRSELSRGSTRYQNHLNPFICPFSCLNQRKQHLTPLVCHTPKPTACWSPLRTHKGSQFFFDSLDTLPSYLGVLDPLSVIAPASAVCSSTTYTYFRTTLSHTYKFVPPSHSDWHAPTSFDIIVTP
jgi:hypothetical protein